MIDRIIYILSVVFICAVLQLGFTEIGRAINSIPAERVMTHEINFKDVMCFDARMK